MKPRVWISNPLIESEIEVLHDQVDADIRPHAHRATAEEVCSAAPGACGLLVAYGAEVGPAAMDAAGDSLKIIANFGVGYDNIDVDAATERNILVSNTPNVVVDATADLTFGLLIAAARRFGEGQTRAHEDRWLEAQASLLGQQVSGATLGIIGLGRIGAAVARRAGGFGMRVIYHSRTAKPDLEFALGIQPVALDTLLREADFITLHCALNEETRHILDAASFARMKRTAVVINTGRGGLIHQDALRHAVRGGLIAGAGLDVTDPEPPAPDDPILHTPGIFVVPHLGSASYQARAGMTRMCVENILATLKGEPPPNCVNREVLAAAISP